MDTVSLRTIASNGPIRDTSIVSTPPNGGTTAWLKVLGGFIIFQNTYGIASTFGAYQAYYQTYGLKGYSSSSISWVGTTQVFLLGLAGVVAGPLYDRGYVRSILGLGSFLVVFGFFMLSLSKSYYQILLSQGICIGIGQGLVYVPAVSIIANTFTSRRPIAIGLAASGSAVGGVILPLMFKELQPTIGFQWTNRVFGFLTLSTFVLAIFLLHPSTQSSPRRVAFFDMSAIREPPFLILCIGLFLIELGYWIPPFTIPVYAQTKLQTSTGFASNILVIMNAGGFAGRILPAYLAQVKIIGPAWVLVAGTLSLGMLILCWISVHNRAGLIVWSIMVGFMSGITVSLPNAVVPRLSPYNYIGARTGMMWSFVAFAALIGAPIAAVLVGNNPNTYLYGQLFSGVSICVGALLLFAPALHISKKRSN